jgi:hypothetical protein
MQYYPDLLFVWAMSITWCTIFLIGVSFYLYLRRKSRSPDSRPGHVRLTDFLFVLVLAGLLGLYIVSINRTSAVIFAVGNIVVEIVLFAYTVRNKTVGATETRTTTTN